MHRTQIILEDWQYQVLRAQAEQEGRSMSELVREILHAALSPAAHKTHKTNRLNDIEGVGEDAASYGRRHDEFLYGDLSGVSGEKKESDNQEG